MNKKLITALVAVAAVLALSFCLAACGDDGTQPGGGDGGDGAVAHTISVDAPDDVEVTTSVSQATVGTKVTVTVVTPAWKIVTFVTAADVNIVKDEAASAGDTAVFTFTMPDRDVELNVETMDSGASVDEDDGLKWVAAPKQIAPGEYSFQKATYEVDFGEAILASMDGDGFLIDINITSTNQDVIPDEAIAGAYRIGDSAVTGGAKFTVDLTKVSLGATTLVFEDSRGRTIAKYVQSTAPSFRERSSTLRLRSSTNSTRAISTLTTASIPKSWSCWSASPTSTGWTGPIPIPEPKNMPSNASFCRIREARRSPSGTLKGTDTASA